MERLKMEFKKFVIIVTLVSFVCIRGSEPQSVTTSQTAKTDEQATAAPLAAEPSDAAAATAIPKPPPMPETVESAPVESGAAATAIPKPPPMPETVSPSPAASAGAAAAAAAPITATKPAESVAGVPPYRMVMLIDSSGSEKLSFASNTTVTIALFNLLKTSAAPILVQLSLLNNLLRRMYEKRYVKFPGSIIFRDKKRIDFSQWDIYYKDRSNFVLMIPHTMRNVTKEQELKLSDGSSMKVQPLKISEREKIVPKALSSLGQSLEQNLVYRVSGLTSGSQLVSTASAAVKKYFFSEDDIASKLRTIGVRDAAVASAFRSSLHSWNLLIIGHGSAAKSIAGLPTRNFQKLLLSLNDLNVSLATVQSCYVGGKNRNVITALGKELKTQHLRYPVAIIGTQNSTVFRLSNVSKYLHFFESIEKRSDPNWLAHAVKGFTVKEKGYIQAENFMQVFAPGTSGFSPVLPVKTKGPADDPILAKSLSKVMVLGTVVSRRFAVEAAALRDRIKRLKTLGRPLSKKEEKQLREAKDKLRFGIRIDGREVAYVLLKKRSFFAPIMIGLSSDTTQNVPIFLPMVERKDKTAERPEFYRFRDMTVVEIKKNYGGIFHFLKMAFGQPRGRTNRVKMIIKTLKGKSDFSSLNIKTSSEDDAAVLQQFKDLLPTEGNKIVLKDVEVEAKKITFSRVSDAVTILIKFTLGGSRWKLKFTGESYYYEKRRGKKTYTDASSMFKDKDAKWTLKRLPAK